MKLNPLYRTLATLVFGISSLNASAAMVLAGSGSTVDFYYDNAFWSNVTTTVVNDRITFAFQPGLQAAATAANGFASQEGSATPGEAALVVVAKSGYSFAGMPLGLVAGVAGSYALAPTGGTVSAFSGASVYEGSFSGGVFSSAQYLTDVFADATAVSDEVAASGGAFDVDGMAPGSALAGPALGLLDVFYSVFASQDGAGESAISLDSLSYTVSANAMATVPEPGSLILLLSALGLAGWAGRGQTTRNRRQNAAA